MIALASDPDLRPLQRSDRITVPVGAKDVQHRDGETRSTIYGVLTSILFICSSFVLKFQKGSQSFKSIYHATNVQVIYVHIGGICDERRVDFIYSHLLGVTVYILVRWETADEISHARYSTDSFRRACIC